MIRLAAPTVAASSCPDRTADSWPGDAWLGEIVILWHIGGTIAIIRYSFRDERMDLRFLILGAVLPDVIDKPIGLIFYDSLGSTRLVAHSILFASILMVAVLLTTRRGRPRKRWMPLAVGVLVHLVLDFMWGSPETLWWPFLGWEFSQGDALTGGSYVGGVFSDWERWGLEAVGAAYLAYLWVQGGLSQPDRRREFVTTGRIDVSIGRS